MFGKTGQLVAGTIIFSGQTVEQVKPLLDFLKSLRIAFQIVDSVGNDLGTVTKVVVDFGETLAEHFILRD